MTKKVMKSMFVLIFLINGVAMELAAQQNRYLDASESDPEAVALLGEMSRMMAGWEAMRLEFDFEYQMTDGSKYAETGVILQEGNKYRFEMGDQLVVCDGKYQWLYLTERNEVQISDVEDAGGQLTPTYFLDFHQSDDYVFAITGRKSGKEGSTIVRVDFKPLPEFPEFAKIGLDIDESSKLPVEMVVILQEGGRYLFQDIRFQKVGGQPADLFVFNASVYPGIHIEDLRLD
jgi:outer membrane lipoprotein-sorting protein